MNEQTMAPTLIVGLGGIGSDIVARLAARVTDPEKKSRVNFVVFDTDANDLRKIMIKSREGKGEKISIIQTSTNLTVGDYLSYDKITRDETFPNHPILFRKTLTEGAGQVRAISHLAFVTAMKNGDLKPLNEAIEDLYQRDSTDVSQSLRVIIVSTLAGGTGSGLILPVSMYIRQFIKTKMNMPSNITRGFFILPEILHSVVEPEPQRNALKANAYATLKELNAFFLKADGRLSEQHKDKVSLKFPINNSDEFEEYDVLPMDYCFMFDAQDLNGTKLNNFEQYKEHAATCIYNMAISPMNKKNNSMEDNTIRALVEGKGQNRYCGVGASELIYPTYDIVRYIALKWATKTVKEHWTLFDKEFVERMKINENELQKGKKVQDLDQGDIYIRTVDNHAKADTNILASYIYNSSRIFDDNNNEIGTKYAEYLKKIYQHIDKLVAPTEIESPLSALKSNISSLNSGKEKVKVRTFMSTFENMKQYREYVKRIVNEKGDDAGFTLFKNTKNDKGLTHINELSIEQYMVDDKRDFLHPNAIRYFLYMTLKTLEKERDLFVKNLKTIEEKFLILDELFDDPATPKEEKIETIFEHIENLKKKKEDRIKAKSFLQRLFNKEELDDETEIDRKEIDDKIQEYNNHLQNINRYRKEATYLRVFTQAITYVDGLCKKFQMFYNTFDDNLEAIHKIMLLLEEKYSSHKGNTIRYICASKKCLEEFSKRMDYHSSAVRIPSNLSQKIYEKVKDFTFKQNDDDMNDTSQAFKEIFTEDIVQYFIKSVDEKHGNYMKMDVLSALEREAEFYGVTDRQKIYDYVERVIEETENLATPFINKPHGQMPYIFSTCSYNENLFKEDDLHRDVLVNKFLKNGVMCKNEDDTKEGFKSESIYFFKAIYDLYPNNLQKFSPKSECETDNKPEGEYRKSYHFSIQKIEEDKAITPHLNKRWHIDLPDLNDEMNQFHDKNLFKAVVYGLLFKKITYDKDYNNWVYNLFLGEKIDLSVSNETKCDKFYELLDALENKPKVVNDLIKAVEKELDEDRHTYGIEESKLWKKLYKTGSKEFLTLPELFKNVDIRMSIFDIVGLYKATTPAGMFSKEKGFNMLKTTLELLYEQFSKYCQPSELADRYQNLIENQLDVFKANFVFTEKTKEENYLEDTQADKTKDFKNNSYKKDYPRCLSFLKDMLQHTKEIMNSMKNIDEVQSKISKVIEYLEGLMVDPKSSEETNTQEKNKNKSAEQTNNSSDSEETNAEQTTDNVPPKQPNTKKAK